MADNSTDSKAIETLLSKLKSEGKSDSQISQAISELYNKSSSKLGNSSSGSGIDISSFSNIMTSGIEQTKSTKGGIKSLLEVMQKGLNGDIGGIVNKFAEDTLGGYLERTNKLLENTNQVMGMSGKLSKDFQTNIINVWPHAERLGISFEELNESITSMVSNSGKFKVLNLIMNQCLKFEPKNRLTVDEAIRLLS